jgi:hypothetical protein
MKASDNFQINQAWWKKEKPVTLKTTGLGAVMKKYQDAKGKITTLASKGKYSGEFAGSVTPFEAAEAILDNEIPKAVDKAKGMCSKTFHKDTITVLDKYKAAITLEKNALQQLETAFNNTYKQTHYTPLMNQATQVETGLKTALQNAEKLSKEADASAKIILKRFAYLKGLEKNGMMAQIDIDQAKADVKGDVAKVQQIVTDLEKMLKSAENDESTAQKLNGKMTNVLSFRDQDLLRKKLNSIASLKNYVLEVTKKTTMTQTSVLTNMREFKAQLSGKQTSVPKQIVLLTELQKSMTGNEFATRKLENAFTNILPGLPKMIKAVKEAKDRASIVIPPEVNVPVDKWLAQVQEWHALAKTHADKCAQILKDSKDTMEKVFAKVEKAVQDGKDGKPLVEDIKSKYSGIEKYKGICDQDVQQFDQKLKLLQTEFSKK